MEEYKEYLTEIKVRGYHVDFYGHVNNARYLEFLEEGRWALFESRIDLHKWVEQGLLFLVVNININYRRAVGVGEILQVATCLDKVGRKSAVLRQEIVLKTSRELVADALVTFVIMDGGKKAVVMENEVLRQILKLDRAGTAKTN